MTATDELRRLLDERGAEWIGTSFSTPTKGHPTNTSLGEEHHEATFIEYDDGNVLRLFDLTPEQAVEATLGSDLKAENEQLRRERDFYFQQVTDNGERAHRAIDALLAENAELRELVRDFYPFSSGRAAKPWLAVRRDRMRELGVDA